MSKIEQFIQKFCPNGVTHESLGKLGEFYGGLSGKSKDDFLDGNAKLITYKNVYSNPALMLDAEDRVRIYDNEKQRTLQYGDIIFTGSSETPEECGISSVVTVQTNEKLYLNSFCFFFRFNDLGIMLPDFSKHLFRSGDIRYQIKKAAKGVTRYNVSKKLMEKVIIPIPPLDVQREIVRILDDLIEFATELTTELTAELKERKKQYEYYRDILLDDVSGEEYYLQDICQIIDCPHTSPKWKESGIPVIRNYNLINGTISTKNLSYVDEAEYKERVKRVEPQMNDILFSREAPIGNVGIIPAGMKCCQGQRVVLLRANTDIVIPQYLLYGLQSRSVKEQIEEVKKIGSTVSNYNISDLKKLKVIIPSLDRQNYSIEKMRKLNASFLEIKNSLLREIELRQNQYLYYRDKLLRFKKVGV